MWFFEKGVFVRRLKRINELNSTKNFGDRNFKEKNICLSCSNLLILCVCSAVLNEKKTYLFTRV